MNNRGVIRSSSLLIVGLATVSSILGCGSGVPFDIVPVNGKVTYEDGSLIPADSILVTFNPILSGEKGSVVPPGGQTNVNVQDGTFSAVSSRRAYDGVAVGKHKVVVVAFKKGPNGSPAPSAAIPPIYNKETSTPLEVEIESKDQFLELKIRKK